MNIPNKEYILKIEDFFLKDLRLISEPKIIEFGVRFGFSTKKIIEICEKNRGFLHSVDIDDCSDISNSKSWKFYKTRDDNFNYLDSLLPRNVDLIYLDSFHNANHVEKIIYHYYPFLKENGKFIIDDISWLPYLKMKKRNNFNCEINNQETFERILEIHSENNENFDLYFSFTGSGMAKLVKKNKIELSKPKKLISRKYSIKNFIRKLIK